MRENRYHTLLEEIQVPEEMKERILSTASRQTERPAFRRKQPVWRAAACAVLAVVLVAGGISLRLPEKESEQVEFVENLEQLGLTCEFGLTAYAVDTLPAANGNLVLGNGKADGEGEFTTTELIPEREQYTRYRFQVCGEQIESLALRIDRGGLYRVKNGQSLISVLEQGAVETYDPYTVYGLWVPPQEFRQGQGTSILNGATLTVTARFADGSQRTNTYRLTAQRLLISENEDGTELLVPALEGNDQTDVSGLYLESLNSVWFHWPVEGANTVSLSNRYGYRWNPGGESRTFHAGIDIPAESGTAITAAAGGTVTEAGYDPAKGNYLILNHENGMETVYAHCLSLYVKVGDSVAAGNQIAAVGSTGLSTGPHLHFEVRQNGEAQNPVAYFDREVRETLRMR